MSMGWEYICSRCHRDYDTCHPNRFGTPYVCSSCWTDDDTKI